MRNVGSGFVALLIFVVCNYLLYIYLSVCFDEIKAMKTRHSAIKDELTKMAINGVLFTLGAVMGLALMLMFILVFLCLRAVPLLNGMMSVVIARIILLMETFASILALLMTGSGYIRPTLPR